MNLCKIKCEKCDCERIPRVETPVRCSRCGHVPGTAIRNKKATPVCLAAHGVADNPTLKQEDYHSK